MTQRPPRKGAAEPSQYSPIHPNELWVLLSKEQQTVVFQVILTMCQECLMPREETTHDDCSPLSENHDDAPAAQSRRLHSAIHHQTSAAQPREPAQSTGAG